MTNYQILSNKNVLQNQDKRTSLLGIALKAKLNMNTEKSLYIAYNTQILTIWSQTITEASQYYKIYF